MRGWRDKSPGLKILWFWTFGTAAVLVTNVVRTRMQDMDKLLRDETDPSQPPPGDSHPVLLPTTPLDPPGKSST